MHASVAAATTLGCCCFAAEPHVVEHAVAAAATTLGCYCFVAEPHAAADVAGAVVHGVAVAATTRGYYFVVEPHAAAADAVAAYAAVGHAFAAAAKALDYSAVDAPGAVAVPVASVDLSAVLVAEPSGAGDVEPAVAGPAVAANHFRHPFAASAPADAEAAGVVPFAAVVVVPFAAADVVHAAAADVVHAAAALVFEPAGVAARRFRAAG